MSLKYRPDIDGLRAIAIGLVVIFHFHIATSGQAGFIGVDVFFVISGFLITGIIAHDVEVGSFHLGSFLYRRVRRLYPALLATFLGFGLFAWFRFLPALSEELAKETILSLLYVVNVYFWRTVNYFGLHADTAPLLHTWSLAVEEQFYLLFPPFCILVYRLARHRLLFATVCLGLFSFCLGVLASTWKPEAAFYLLPTRAWELMIGAVLALTVKVCRPPAWLAQSAGPLGLVLIVWALVIHTPATPVPGWFAVLPTLGGAALIVGGFEASAPVTRLLSTQPMVWIGRISYPLYLVHWPIWIALQDQLSNVTLSWRLFGVLLSVLLAWMIYRFIETPLRHGRMLEHPGRFLGLVAGFSGILAAAAAAVVAGQGLPQRYSPEVQELLAYANDLPKQYSHCEDLGQTKHEQCHIGAPDTLATALLMGDSHARALAEAFNLYLKRKGQAANFTFLNGCLPVLGAGSAACTGFSSRAVQFAASNPSIKRVFLVSIWRQPFEGQGMLFGDRWKTREETPQAFTEALLVTIDRLQAAGKEVILIEPLYASPHDVPETLARNLAFEQSWPVDQPYKTYRTIFADLFLSFDQAQSKGARRVSLIGEMCESGTCPGTWQGRPTFTDNNHLTMGQSPYMAQMLERALN